MTQSNLFFPFILQVFAPIMLLFLIERIIHYKMNQGDLRPKVAQRLKDTRLVLRVIALPLLVLLFFNFKNLIQPENNSYTGTHSQGNSGDPWYQSMERQEGTLHSKATNITSNQRLVGEVSGHIGGILLLLLSLSLLLLAQIRLSPRSALPINFQPTALFSAINNELLGSQALGFLRWLWVINLPLFMIVAMQFLPYTWHYWLHRSSFYLALSLLLYALWQSRKVVKIRGQYLEALLAIDGDPRLLHIRNTLQRIAFDQEQRHHKLLILAYEEFEERVKILYILLIASTFFGYAVL